MVCDYWLGGVIRVFCELVAAAVVWGVLLILVWWLVCGGVWGSVVCFSSVFCGYAVAFRVWCVWVLVMVWCWRNCVFWLAAVGVLLRRL